MNTESANMLRDKIEYLFKQWEKGNSSIKMPDYTDAQIETIDAMYNIISKDSTNKNSYFEITVNRYEDEKSIADNIVDFFYGEIGAILETCELLVAAVYEDKTAVFEFIDGSKIEMDVQVK